MNIDISCTPASAGSASRAPHPAGFKVDLSRGERIGRVSSEWLSRPDDERYLSLSDLYASVCARTERATARTVESRAVRVEAKRDDAEQLALIVPGRDCPIAPTHWSFGQLCSLVGAPAGYLRDLPAPLAGINLQHGLLSHRGELVKTLEAQDGRVELRAVTGPDYGRIWDHELVGAVMKIAGNDPGDMRWKVPGVLDCLVAEKLGRDAIDALFQRAERCIRRRHVIPGIHAVSLAVGIVARQAHGHGMPFIRQSERPHTARQQFAGFRRRHRGRKFLHLSRHPTFL
jgi:hypothetical protein